MPRCGATLQAPASSGNAHSTSRISTGVVVVCRFRFGVIFVWNLKPPQGSALASSIMSASRDILPAISAAVNPAEPKDFVLRDDHVRLCDLLKLTGIAGSGGQGKQLAASGAVCVDGVVETRKTAKIRAGQRVECGGVCVRVLAAPGAPGGAA